MSLDPLQKVNLNPSFGGNLQVGLAWDFKGEKIDIDATCVLLNDLGCI